MTFLPQRKALQNASQIFHFRWQISSFLISVCGFVRISVSAHIEKEKCHQFSATQQTAVKGGRFAWIKWNYVKFISFSLLCWKVFLRHSICRGIACHSECQNGTLCECLLCFKLNFPWIIVVRWNLENCWYVCKCFTIYIKPRCNILPTHFCCSMWTRLFVHFSVTGSRRNGKSKNRNLW